MAFVLDTGALIAAERGDARLVALLAAAHAQRQPIRVPSGVVAQAWRGGSRHARLARLLESVSEVPLDEIRSRRAGELLAEASRSDIVDASVIDLTRSGDVVLTSDPDDLRHLARAAKIVISIREV